MRIIIGGTGGQGVLTLGKVISYACMNRDLNISCFPVYGAEMRGGYVHCILTISNAEEILSPISSECDIGIFMEETSFNTLSSYLKTDGIIISNSSLIKNNKSVYQFPATEQAEKIGNSKVTNMFFAGLVIPFIKKFFKDFKKEDMFYGVDKTIKKGEMNKLSKKAIEIGLEYGTEKWKI